MSGPRFSPRTGVASLGGLRPQVPGLQQPRLQFVGHAIETRLPPDLCLLGCIFVITDYQDMDEAKHLPAWKKVITQYGGELEESLSPRVTHLLCATQKSQLAQQARLEGKRLITAFWLNDTVVRKKVLPPWKAVHFPLPAGFEPPCTNMVITLTGFENRDRDYVKDMIKMVGAKYTGYFTKHNHAIICKTNGGVKYEKAGDWKVPVVSVQWLNDVLFGSVNASQCMNNPKYQQFKLDEPLRIDYSLVSHLIGAWKNPIRVTQDTYQKFKANPPARIKRKAERQRQEREAEAKRLKEEEERRLQGLPPLDPLPPPPLPPVGGAMGMPPAMNGQNGPMSGGNIVMGPNGQPIRMPNGMPGPPVPNGSVDTGETAMDTTDNTDTPMDVDEAEKEDVKPDVKQKPRVIFSGMTSSERTELGEIVTELGGRVVEKAPDATHLVMPVLQRTASLLQAIPTVSWILSPAWLKQSKEKSEFEPESDHLLTNPEVEAMYQFSLTKTLARTDRNKLFSGKTFYVTPGVKPSYKIIHNIVEAAGGSVDSRRRRSVPQIKELNKNKDQPSYLIITCEDDLHIVQDVLKAKIGVYNTEFVMGAVLRCELDFDLSQYITTV